MIARMVLALSIAALAGGCRANKIGHASCTPGEPVFIGCGCGGVGECNPRPNPVLRVCDGVVTDDEDCTWDVQLGENDDGPGCGLCPGLTVTCPPSGELLVIARGFYPNEVVHCEWALGAPPTE